MKTQIHIESVDFTFFKTFILHHVYIEDQTGDTLLFIRHLKVDLNDFSFKQKKIVIDEIALTQPTIKLKQLNDSLTNFQFLIDALANTSQTTDTTSYTILVKKFRMILANFRFDDKTIPHSRTKEIDFNHLHIRKINLNIDSIYLNDSITFSIKRISFLEQSGFSLNHLSCKGTFNQNGIFLQQLSLLTPNSILRARHFSLETPELYSFRNFVEKVRFNIDFLPSKIHSNDLSFFADILSPINRFVYFAGKVKGPLASLRFRDFQIKHRQYTFIKGNYDIDGLIVSNNPFLSLRLTKLTTHPAEIDNLSFHGGTLTIPEEIKRMGTLYFKGELSGFINDFVVYGKCQTNLGNIKSDITLKYDTLKKSTKINGYLALYDFAIGQIIQQYPIIKNTSLEINVSVDIFKNNVKGNAKGTIRMLDFNNYNYQNILIDGSFTEKLFDGNLQLNDPNIKLDFLGKIDYSDKIPVFNFMADVQKAKLNKINLIHPDSNITISFLLDARIRGLNLDELQGNIDLYQVTYEHLNTYHFPFIHFSASSNNGKKELMFDSDILKASINGHFQYNNTLYSLQNIISHYLPSYNIVQIPKKHKHDENFEAQLFVKFNNQCSFLKEILPELTIANNTQIDLKLSYPQEIRCSIKSDSITYNQIKIFNAQVELINNKNLLETRFNCKQFCPNKSLFLNDLNSKILSHNDQNELYITWNNNDSLIGDAELSAILTLQNKQVDITFTPSRIFFNHANWYINDGNLVINDSNIFVRNTIINESQQYFMLHGLLGKKITDTLHLYMSEFQMSTLNPFLQNQSISLNGIIDGNIKIIKALEKPILWSDIYVQKLQINSEDLGDLKLIAEWNDEKQELQYQANAYRGNIQTLQIQGTYDQHRQIDAMIKLDKWRLQVLEPMLSSFAKDIRGIASGTISVKGTTQKPILNGKVELMKTAFTIPFLNTRYNFTGEVDIQKDAFSIKEIDIYDEEANKARLTGKITHNNFTAFNIDLLLNSNRFLFMNTHYSDTSLFYGSVYASGMVNIKGNFDQIDIFANVQTEKGTKFNLNLESATEISQNDFIQIVNKQTRPENIIRPNVNPASGLNLTFNIQATPEANVQLIFDSKVGDIIKSQGSGNLRLELKPNGDFLIFGNYIITQGDYLFTLQNVINKRFEVQPGSTVSFNGDPLSAILDIKASYNLRTSLYELMLDSAYKNRVPVSCELSMKNKLLNPLLQFNIVIPNADSRVEGVLSSLSDEEVNKQVISLLVLNRFVTPESYKSGIKTVEYSSSNALGVNSSELLTNQLNHWLSQISKTVNLGVNYRPGDVITNEEIELALNTQILNDRITINTNLGVSNSTQGETSTLIGDFDIEAKLNKSGKLRAKGFNRTNTNILKDTSPYTQGIGIFYREEFDSWEQLFKNYWKMVFARKEEKN